MSDVSTNAPEGNKLILRMIGIGVVVLLIGAGIGFAARPAWDKKRKARIAQKKAAAGNKPAKT